MKKLFLLLAVFATTMCYAQSAELIAPPTTKAAGKTIALTGNYDAGAGHTIGGAGVSFVLREFNTNNNSFLWKADVKDGTTLGTVSGSASGSLTIPAGLTLSSELAAGIEYRLYIAFQDEVPNYTGDFSVITITKGLVLDFEDASEYVAVNTGANVTVTEFINNPNSTGINTSANCMKLVEASGAQAWERSVINGFAGYNLNNGGGQFFKIKYISPKAAGTISFMLSNDSNYQINVSYSGHVNLTDWYEAEFFIPFFGTDTGKWINRFDIGFDLDATGNNAAEEIYYVDEVDRSTFTTLSSNSIEILNKKVSIFPNPANNEISIVGDVNIKSVKVFDILGKEVMSSINSTSINVSQLVSGVYILKTNTGSVSRFVKK